MKHVIRGFAAGVACAVAAGGGVAAWLVLDTLSFPEGRNPFPEPIGAGHEVIVVEVEEFASLPRPEANPTGRPARMMMLADEPGTGRLFVNGQQGVLYGIGYDGRDVVPYLDLSDPRWRIDLADCRNVGGSVQQYPCQEGFHSFAFHPQFADAGTPGFGKLYTYADTKNDEPPADFEARWTPKEYRIHTLLLEWQVRDPQARRYDGGAPVELMRIAQPYVTHNGGQIGFRPALTSGDPDFGMLYVSVGDGGGHRDPQDLAQDRGRIFGKFLRIDPLGSNSANGRYGIPADNPFADDGDDDTLGEIWAYGLRNPHRFGWDARTGRLLVADIGRGVIEEINLVTAGANLGWSHWEGRYLSRKTMKRDVPRWIRPSFWLDARIAAWPVVEYDHRDPLLMGLVAVTGLAVYRDDAIPQLANLVLFGDLPSGEVFSFPADPLPREGGQASIRRVLFEHRGETKTLLQMIRERTVEQGGTPASRADLRFGTGPDGWVFLLNKSDGIVRRLVPAR